MLLQKIGLNAKKYILKWQNVDTYVKNNFLWQKTVYLQKYIYEHQKVFCRELK